MKITIIIIITFVVFKTSFSQEVTELDLIGEWEFIELQDENGEKHTKIPLSKFEKGAIENINRDNYIFKESKEYISRNPLNTSTGFWSLDSQKRRINLELRISPEDEFLPSLKKAKVVKKREDGFYYQKPIKKQILFFSKDSMTIADRSNFYLIYKKKK